MASPHACPGACVTRTVASPDHGKSAETATPSVPPASGTLRLAPVNWCRYSVSPAVLAR